MSVSRPNEARKRRAVRDPLEARGLLCWDDPNADHGSQRSTLRERLPADLRAAPGPDFARLPFTSLYLVDDEWAAEIASQTVHGVMHIGWIPDGVGGPRGQMAVPVKPKGFLGIAYMAAIRPFRHLIVYPPLMREIGRDWRADSGPGAAAMMRESDRERLERHGSRP